MTGRSRALPNGQSSVGRLVGRHSHLTQHASASSFNDDRAVDEHSEKLQNRPNIVAAYPFDSQNMHDHTSRFGSITDLPAAIVHELNQPLMSMRTNAQAAKRWLSNDPPNIEQANASIDRILRDTMSADETVQQIRTLFKYGSSRKTLVGVSDVISRAVSFVLEDPSRHEVVIDSCLDNDLPQVTADPIQLQMVLVNLIANAIEAGAECCIYPVITIRATMTADHELLLQVVDNGPGISDTEKVFDAFVTTKERGMGIGLTLSRWIVEAHGGRLWARNNTDRGATFCLALPLPDL